MMAQPGKLAAKSRSFAHEGVLSYCQIVGATPPIVGRLGSPPGQLPHGPVVWLSADQTGVPPPMV